MRISDWSSDVCSSDLGGRTVAAAVDDGGIRNEWVADDRGHRRIDTVRVEQVVLIDDDHPEILPDLGRARGKAPVVATLCRGDIGPARVGIAADRARGRILPLIGQQGLFEGIAHSVGVRSEEHTSELQSLMRISYAVFCLKKKKRT